MSKAASDFGKQGIARYKYIHLPLHYKGGGKVTNEFFMKFEEFHQTRNYKNKLRRIYKEKPTPFFSNQRTPEKGFISIKISDQISINFAVNNITDEAYFVYTGDKRYNAQYESYGRSYTLGVQWVNW